MSGPATCQNLSGSGSAMSANECVEGWNPAAETHESWKRRRASYLQRERRARLRRIDFYGEPDACAVIDRLRRPSVGGDASSIINRIILEWAENRRKRRSGIE